jgi:uncharacterized membrane protein YczE
VPAPGITPAARRGGARAGTVRRGGAAGTVAAIDPADADPSSPRTAPRRARQPSPTALAVPAGLSMPQRLVRLIASWVAVGLAIPLILRAELGASPFDVLNTGVSELVGWSFGTSFVVNSILFFAVGRMLGARLGWACLAGTLVIGPFVDLVLGLIPEQERLAVRIPFLVIGILVIAVGICLVIPTELGPGPTEVLMLGLVARGMGVVPARWISDGLPVVVGAVFGGAFGIGTVVWVAAMGPIVKWGLRRMGYVPPRLVVAEI